MPWCQTCKTEYDPVITRCVDCGSSLVGILASDEPDDPPVCALRATTLEQAEIARATLLSEGIVAYVGRTSFVLPQVDNSVDDDIPELAVLVPNSELERAITILSEAPVSEEELTEVEEAAS